MSSAGYSSRLQPDPGLRRIVLATACILIAAGGLAIATLPFSPWLCGLAAVGWCALSGWRLLRIAAAWRELRSYRLSADGSVAIATVNGGQRTSRLGAGSVVLERVAWLCLDSDRGQNVDVVRAGDPQSQQWRRFQVICRHLTTC